MPLKKKKCFLKTISRITIKKTSQKKKEKQRAFTTLTTADLLRKAFHWVHQSIQRLLQLSLAVARKTWFCFSSGFVGFYQGFLGIFSGFIMFHMVFICFFCELLDDFLVLPRVSWFFWGRVSWFCELRVIFWSSRGPF